MCRFDIIAIGVGPGQEEQLEHIAHKNERYIRIASIRELNKDIVHKKTNFWITNPTKGKYMVS